MQVSPLMCGFHLGTPASTHNNWCLQIAHGPAQYVPQLSVALSIKHKITLFVKICAVKQ